MGPFETLQVYTFEIGAISVDVRRSFAEHYQCVLAMHKYDDDNEISISRNFFSCSFT